MFCHYATFKISPISKIATFSEDRSFLNPRSHLKDTLKAFDDFKATKVYYEVMFLICKSTYILKVYLIHYTLRKNPNIKKFSFGQNKRYKKCTLFSFASSNPSQFYV